MPSGTPKGDLVEKSPGLREQIISLILGIKAYSRARGELLAIEGKEAATIIGRKAGLGGLGLFFLLVGYLTLLVSLIGIVGQYLEPETRIQFRGWVGGSLIISGVHLLIGFFLLVVQKRIGRGVTLLEVTRAEFKKDRQWLNKEKENL